MTLQWHHHLYQSWWRVVEYSWSSCFAFVVSLIYTDASLLIYFLSESLSQCTPSPTRGQATHQFLFLSSVFSYSAEIFTTSVQGFGRGGASGLGGGGASGLALELFEGGVGILMIAVVTSPLLLQFKLPDSSDIRLRLERLRQRERERDRGLKTLFILSLVYLIWLLTVY